MPVDSVPQIGPLPILEVLPQVTPTAPGEGAFARELAKDSAKNAAGGTHAGNSLRVPYRNATPDRSPAPQSTPAERSASKRPNTERSRGQSHSASAARTDQSGSQNPNDSNDETVAGQVNSAAQSESTTSETEDAVEVDDELQDEVDIADDTVPLPTVVAIDSPLPIADVADDEAEQAVATETTTDASADELSAANNIATTAEVPPATSAVQAKVADPTAAAEDSDAIAVDADTLPATDASVTDNAVDGDAAQSQVASEVAATVEPVEAVTTVEADSPTDANLKTDEAQTTAAASADVATQVVDEAASSENQDHSAADDETTQSTAVEPVSQDSTAIEDDTDTTLDAGSSSQNQDTKSPVVAAANAEANIVNNNATVEAPSSAGAVQGTSPSRFQPAPRSHQTSERGHTTAPDVDASRFVQRVTRAFAAAESRGGEVRLRLSPPELGSLHLSVSVDNGTLTARIETETHVARTILLDNLPQLKERLAEQGMQIERFDVDVSGQNSGGLPDSPQGERENREPGWRQQSPSSKPARNDASSSRRSDGKWDDNGLNVLV